MYIQDGFNYIQSSSRCRMYKKIKHVHKPEAYFTVNINNKVCTSFTKFRLSSQKLLVEYCVISYHSVNIFNRSFAVFYEYIFI